MNQAASLVPGIVLSSLLTNEVTCYIPKSGQPFVAGHCQPHSCKLSAFDCRGCICTPYNATRSCSQVGPVSNTAIDLIGK